MSTLHKQEVSDEYVEISNSEKFDGFMRPCVGVPKINGWFISVFGP